MADLKKEVLGDYRETMEYAGRLARSGLTKMTPVIISCAITGGIHGKEANPNLPEKPEEQAAQAYDAYNAGASLVHIHARDPKNWSLMSQNTEDFMKVNTMVRAKCPDIIVNNTCLGGRMVSEQARTISEQLWVSIGARPEVASVDIVATCQKVTVGERKAPLSNPRPAAELPFDYIMTQDDAVRTVQEMEKFGVKPELELFEMGDVRYIYNMAKAGVLKGPYWIQMIFGGTGIYPSPEFMIAAANMLPPESLLSIIGIGACQTAVITQAMLLGHHIRVGLEDNVVYGPGQLATSNAQLVERAVRIARELGRPVATPAQAREIMGLGAPRQYS
ncbi:3-keto-5-aminohexanoate cleavage protein [Papillibacter cinnamivorans]|uniref:3-keto-5-aminohexanoate cleavage enzyme n=1 Tax=Papillibacter cinnamivorans DSM 12816 TaxID=1122930 RepID=A0A1W2CC13_9FIRM|nr:3-keto-5-aminohexanoate cleavage protein [Papillibacter cinnamivorans]SMC82661.1 3-keto-5-aminohexanoate cleavage enzyme [Papillibacter cinnamivorans DSM 12816]